MRQYVVIQDPAWLTLEIVEANGAMQAARKSGRQGELLVVPVRNLTVIEAVTPEPVQPPPRFDEQDALAWVTGVAEGDPRNRDANPHPDKEIEPDSRSVDAILGQATEAREAAEAATS